MSNTFLSADDFKKNAASQQHPGAFVVKVKDKIMSYHAH